MPGRRIPTQGKLEREVLGCIKERNDQEIKNTCRFTIEDARHKLKRHYDDLKNACLRKITVQEEGSLSSAMLSLVNIYTPKQIILTNLVLTEFPSFFYKK